MKKILVGVTAALAVGVTTVAYFASRVPRKSALSTYDPQTEADRMVLHAESPYVPELHNDTGIDYRNLVPGGRQVAELLRANT